MTALRSFWRYVARRRLQLGPNWQLGLPNAQKIDGVARRRLEKDGHMGNPGLDVFSSNRQVNPG